MSLAGLAKCGRSKDMGGEGFAPTKVFDPTNKLESVGAAPPPTTWAHTHTYAHCKALHYTFHRLLSNVPSDASNLLRLASTASPISGYLWENADHPTTSRWIFAPPNHLTNNQTLPKHLTKRFPTNLLGKHEMAHRSNFPLDFFKRHLSTDHPALWLHTSVPFISISMPAPKNYHSANECDRNKVSSRI